MLIITDGLPLHITDIHWLPNIRDQNTKWHQKIEQIMKRSVKEVSTMHLLKMNYFLL